MSEDEIVWQGELDGRYKVTVLRTGPYRGTLRIEDVDDGRKLHEQDVGLMFNALFGPDVADVARWQEIPIRVVDRDRTAGDTSPSDEPGGG